MKKIIPILVIQFLFTTSIYSQNCRNIPDSLCKKYDIKEIIKKYNFKINGKVIYVVRQSNSVQRYKNYNLFYENKPLDSLSKFQDKMNDYLKERIDSFIFNNKTDTNIFIINEFENGKKPVQEEEVCVLIFENDTKYYFFYWFGNIFSPFVGNERNKKIKYKYIDFL